MSGGVSKAGIKVPSVMIGSIDGSTLLSHLPLKASLVRYTRPLLDPSYPIMLVIAVCVITAGAWWSAEEYQLKRRGYAHLRVYEEAQPNPEVTYIDEGSASSFILFASAGLLLLFFFIDKLIYAVIVIFAVGGAHGVYACLVGLVKWWLPQHGCLQRTKSFPIFGEVQLLHLLLVPPSLLLSTIWVFARNLHWGWILQDILSVALLLLIQQEVRLPNIKVASILLSLAFAYDIFWVFISPFLFSSSVMIHVATGGGTGQPIPMVLRLPHIQDKLGGYSILGLGDIALPGLLVSFLYRFDQRWGLRTTDGYFLPISIGYSIGLLLTYIALVATGHGQPALLYLVPSTLGTAIILGKKRGHLQEMWNTPIPPNDLGCI